MSQPNIHQRIFLENVIKNIVLLVFIVATYIPLQEFLTAASLSTDKGLAGDFLVAVSIIAVTACFGNFAFSYENLNLKSQRRRILAHFTTFILMLIIGISLEMVAILSTFLIGDFLIFNIICILLYVGSVMYDFWDLQLFDTHELK